MAGDRLLLFGKLPRPGRVKTRLVPRLGADGAARLYEAMLEDALAAAAEGCAVPVDLVLERPAERDEETRAALARLRIRHSEVGLRWQRGEDLGERLCRAFGRAFADGNERVLAVGTDHPTLPTEYLRRAIRALARWDLVFGPSEDGGYYAVGVRATAWPRAAGVFQEIPWSTGSVLARSLEAARALGLTWEELPSWYDVDEPRDLQRLESDLRPGSRTAAVLRSGAVTRRPADAGEA